MKRQSTCVPHGRKPDKLPGNNNNNNNNINVFAASADQQEDFPRAKLDELFEARNTKNCDFNARSS